MSRRLAQAHMCYSSHNSKHPFICCLISCQLHWQSTSMYTLLCYRQVPLILFEEIVADADAAQAHCTALRLIEVPLQHNHLVHLLDGGHVRRVEVRRALTYDIQQRYYVTTIINHLPNVAAEHPLTPEPSGNHGHLGLHLRTMGVLQVHGALCRTGRRGLARSKHAYLAEQGYRSCCCNSC